MLSRSSIARLASTIVVTAAVWNSSPAHGQAPPVTSTCLSTTAQQGIAITPVTMVGGGGVGGPYAFSAKGLAAELSISSSGTISGTPTVSGTSSYTVTVTDSAGDTGTVNCTITVKAAPQQKNSPDALDVSTIASRPGTPDGFCSDATSPANVRDSAKWTGHFLWRNSIKGTISTIGTDGKPATGITIDMTGNACLPLPVSLNVPNNQRIRLDVKEPPGQQCTASETAAPLQPPDIGSIISKFLGGLPTAIAVKGAKPLPHFPAQLPPLQNAKATISVSCASTGEAPIVPKKTINITYEGVSPISASAGLLVSLLGSKTYGVVTTETAVTTSGTVNSQYAIGVTSSSTIQLVPIAFLNTYLFGNQNEHIDLQTGLGINPNGSKTRVEYFVGPAIAWHGVYLSPGLHIAQAEYLAPGYAVGQFVSSQGFSVPAPYRTTLRFGISLTYSPKVSSSSSSSNSNSSSK